MKKLIASLLIFFAATPAFADTKISQLPLGSAASTTSSDSFPYVNSTIGQTDRLTLWDLPNLPAFQSVFTTLVPGQTGQSGKCLQSNGSNTLWGNCSAGSVTSVGLLDNSSTPIYSITGSPVTSTGTLTFSLLTQSANKVLAGPTTGSAAQPTFRSLVGADLPNPGASSLGGVESLTCGSHNWLNQISTSGVPACSQPAFSDVSGLVDLTSQVTNTLPAANGGTGQTSIANAFISFYESVATTLGDIIYGGASGTPTRLAGNTTSTTKFLSQTGTGTVSAAPSWVQPSCSNLSNSAASCSTDATNASNISSGTLGLARGGTNANLSATGGTSQVLKQTTLGGAVTVGQLACGDLSNSSASCSTDATNASNISSGTLPAGRLPNPTAATLGGVESIAAVSHNFLTSISTSGVPAQAQPGFSDLSGNISTSQMNSGTGATSTTFFRGDGTWATPLLSGGTNQPFDLSNVGLSTSASGNALTIALTQGDGSTNCSTGAAACTIAFRSSTATSGGFSEVQVTSSLSLTIPSGTTIGTTNGGTYYIYVYALNNAGTVVLGVSLSPAYDNGRVQSSSAISGGSTATTLYTTASQTNLPTRLIGKIQVTESTAGTWASNATEVAIGPYPHRAYWGATGSLMSGTFSTNSATAISLGGSFANVVAGGISCSLSTGSIACTLPITGDYEVCAMGFTTGNGGSSSVMVLYLRDSNGVVIEDGLSMFAAAGSQDASDLCGVYHASSTSATFKVLGSTPQNVSTTYNLLSFRIKEL